MNGALLRTKVAVDLYVAPSYRYSNVSTSPVFGCTSMRSLWPVPASIQSRQGDMVCCYKASSHSTTINFDAQTDVTRHKHLETVYIL